MIESDEIIIAEDSDGTIENIEDLPITSVLINHEQRLFSNRSWDTTSDALKKISLLQGVPITVFSYAAGLFRSNNKYNLFGLIDIFTYISRLNILSSINVRPDITFTFLNSDNIKDSYVSTYRNGLLGCALNIFMNPIDFETMDNVIDVSNQDPSYNEISKITVSSMNNPKYFKTSTNNGEKIVMLHEEKINLYKSIVYGGIDYEQIAVIMNNINSYPDLNVNGPDSFKFNKIIFHYYIESNWNIYNVISNTLIGESGDDPGPLIQAINSVNNVWNNGTNDISYNQIIDYVSKNNSSGQIYDYNYGCINFFRNHPMIDKIYMPQIDPETNGLRMGKFLVPTSTPLIYDSSYDNLKNIQHNRPEYTVVLMPFNIGTLENGKFGFLNNQFTYVRRIRRYTLYDNDEAPNSINNKNYSLFYNIICGLDDNLSYLFLNDLKSYSPTYSRDNDVPSSIVEKTYLCYYDGNVETFRKVLTGNNSSSTLDYFNGLKKVINYNSNNSFINYDTPNLIDNVSSFVYNINEGKAVSLDIVKNNPLSYNNGILLGIDCIILIYITQIYYNDYNRIFSSSEIFYVYSNLIKGSTNLINENADRILSESERNNITTKIDKLKDILDGRYKYYSSSNIYDSYSDISYSSLSVMDFDYKDEFFIFLSELCRRNITTIYQKSFYKIIEFNTNTNYFSNGLITTNYNSNSLRGDFEQSEDKWYDITYLLNNNYVTLLNNDNYSIFNRSKNIFAINKQIFGDISSINYNELSVKIYNTVLYFIVKDSEKLNYYNEISNNLFFADDLLNLDTDFTNIISALGIKKVQIILYYFKILFLFYFNSEQYYNLNRSIETNTTTIFGVTSNLTSFESFNSGISLIDNNYIVDSSANKYTLDFIKLDYVKNYNYNEYIITNGLMNFTIVDVLNPLKRFITLENSLNILELSQNSLTINYYNNNKILELFSFFINIPDDSSKYKHNLLEFFYHFVNRANGILSISTILNNNNFKNLLIEIVNIYKKIGNINYLQITSISYQNNFVELDNSTRYDLLESYNSMFV